jgi:lysozyme family protein
MIINKQSVLSMWQSCQVLPRHVSEAQMAARAALGYKFGFYLPVENITGIPWYVVAALDMREEGCNHNRYLGNGDPLGVVTTHVPSGRGPFNNWTDGAIDSLKLRGFDRLPLGASWDLVTSLLKCDSWNGFGYDHMGLPSPYLWSLTNHQVPGKYVSDGEFDPTFMDTQVGCAALFLALRDLGTDLRE